MLKQYVELHDPGLEVTVGVIVVVGVVVGVEVVVGVGVGVGQEACCVKTEPVALYNVPVAAYGNTVAYPLKYGPLIK